MYKQTKKGKKYVGISQTYTGWNVSTWSVSGNRVRTYKTKNVKTLTEAKKEFTRQKRMLM